MLADRISIKLMINEWDLAQDHLGILPETQSSYFDACKWPVFQNEWKFISQNCRRAPYWSYFGPRSRFLRSLVSLMPVSDPITDCTFDRLAILNRESLNRPQIAGEVLSCGFYKLENLLWSFRNFWNCEIEYRYTFEMASWSYECQSSRVNNAITLRWRADSQFMSVDLRGQIMR